jgi:hypothetical protein
VSELADPNAAHRERAGLEQLHDDRERDGGHDQQRAPHAAEIFAHGPDE